MASSMEKTALVVDDGLSTRLIAMGIARKFGFNTVGASNGQEAVALYESGQRFDLIIMDMNMPIMDGIEATRMSRSKGADCVIVGATASQDEHQRTMFKNAGLNHLLSRPLTKEKLDQLIN